MGQVAVRRSYRALMAMPAWGLYADGRLVATVRAGSKADAARAFESGGFRGDEIRRL